MHFILASVHCVLSLFAKTYCAADNSTGSDHCEPPSRDQREVSLQVDAEVWEGANKKCRSSRRHWHQQTEQVNTAVYA